MNEDFEETDLPASSAGVSDEAAAARLERFFDENQQEVFYSRQLEVAYEDELFHWVTSRALRRLIELGKIAHERREMSSGQEIHLMRHRSHRYYKRQSARLVGLVEEYAHPDIGEALGDHAERMVLEGIAGHRFVMVGRETKEYGEREWVSSEHDLDFIFERDGCAYGVEVKNTLGYMSQRELRTKMDMCKYLGITPLLVARMLPKHWINEIVEAGGFALILKYQLYPRSHHALARRVRDQLGLPVDSPRRLQEGTVRRFVRWHEGRV